MLFGPISIADKGVDSFTKSPGGEQFYQDLKGALDERLNSPILVKETLKNKASEKSVEKKYYKIKLIKLEKFAKKNLSPEQYNKLKADVKTIDSNAEFKPSSNLNNHEQDILRR